MYRHHSTFHRLYSFIYRHVHFFVPLAVAASRYQWLESMFFPLRLRNLNIPAYVFYVFCEIPSHLTAVNAVAYTLQHYMAFSITHVDARRRTQRSQALTCIVIVRLDMKAKNCLFRSGASTFWELPSYLRSRRRANWSLLVALRAGHASVNSFTVLQRNRVH